MRIACSNGVLLFAALAAGAPTPRGNGSAPRIIGGQVVSPTFSYPFLVGISQPGYTCCICGGSLIDRQWVLTAAHCIEQGATYEVLVHGHSSMMDPAYNHRCTQKIGVAQAICHPSYSEITNDGDVCLLKLESVPECAEEMVQNGTLAVLDMADSGLPAAGTPVVIAGWGLTAENDDYSSPDLMHHVTTTMVSHADCAAAYSDVTVITDSMICAGEPEGGKDTCQGDSGGPLFAEVDGVFVQLGVVSFGVGCGRAAYPGVYASAAFYRSWITDTMYAESSAAGEICYDVCITPNDGVCDDGGAGSELSSCVYGYDCTDCGPRTESFPNSSFSPPSPYPPQFSTNCSDTCSFHTFDGTCDDGGDGSMYSLCALGTDCHDCGHRWVYEGPSLLPTFSPTLSPPSPPTSRFPPPSPPATSEICYDVCAHANDGDCDDGGAGSEYESCGFGFDCTDCGPRMWLTSDTLTPPPSPTPPWYRTMCSDTCIYYTNDGDCDDGGDGSAYSLCDLGTDCHDCGYRLVYEGPSPSPPVPPSPSPPPPPSPPRACPTRVMQLCDRLCGTDTCSRCECRGCNYCAPIVVRVVAAGSVGDFEDTSALRLRFASAAHVHESQVEISVVAASVKITANIEIASGTTAADIESRLESSMGTRVAAGMALQLDVQDTPIFSREQQQSANSDSIMGTSTSIFSSFVAGVVVVLVFIGYVIFRRRQRRRFDETWTSRVRPARNGMPIGQNAPQRAMQDKAPVVVDATYVDDIPVVQATVVSATPSVVIPVVNVAKQDG